MQSCINKGYHYHIATVSSQDTSGRNLLFDICWDWVAYNQNETSQYVCCIFNRTLCQNLKIGMGIDSELCQSNCIIAHVQQNRRYH